jgi:hypothetical protein
VSGNKISAGGLTIASTSPMNEPVIVGEQAANAPAIVAGEDRHLRPIAALSNYPYVMSRLVCRGYATLRADLDDEWNVVAATLGLTTADNQHDPLLTASQHFGAVRTPRHRRSRSPAASRPQIEPVAPPR